MDELEAVNVLLSNIGSDAISDLNIGHPDAANARRTLDRAQRRIQRRGWWFNTDYNVNLSPDAATKRILVQDVHQVEVAGYDVIKRGKYLYDRVDQTYQFDGDVEVIKMVRYLTWDDLPDTVKDAAVFLAGAEFVRDEIEDTNKAQVLRLDYESALVDIKRDHIKASRLNMLAHPRTARAAAGVRPYSRGATRSKHFGKVIP